MEHLRTIETDEQKKSQKGKKAGMSATPGERRDVERITARFLQTTSERAPVITQQDVEEYLLQDLPRMSETKRESELKGGLEARLKRWEVRQTAFKQGLYKTPFLSGKEKDTVYSHYSLLKWKPRKAAYKATVALVKERQGIKQEVEKRREKATSAYKAGQFDKSITLLKEAKSLCKTRDGLGSMEDAQEFTDLLQKSDKDIEDNERNIHFQRVTQGKMAQVAVLTRRNDSMSLETALAVAHTLHEDLDAFNNQWKREHGDEYVTDWGVKAQQRVAQQINTIQNNPVLNPQGGEQDELQKAFALFLTRDREGDDYAVRMAALEQELQHDDSAQRTQEGELDMRQKANDSLNDQTDEELASGRKKVMIDLYNGRDISRKAKRIKRLQGVKTGVSVDGRVIQTQRELENLADKTTYEVGMRFIRQERSRGKFPQTALDKFQKGIQAMTIERGEFGQGFHKKARDAYQRGGNANYELGRRFEEKKEQRANELASQAGKSSQADNAMNSNTFLKAQQRRNTYKNVSGQAA